MDLNLAGKTVIVTGGASSIGRGITLCFAKEKVNLVLADIDESQANKTAERARALGSNLLVIKTDTTDPDSVEAMVKKTLAEFKQIHVLYNNVGGNYDTSFMEKKRQDWEFEFKLNYWSFINCTSAVLDHMIEQRYGKIISTASDSAKMGEFREPVYAGSKGAIVASTKAIAREVGRYGININCICPGATPTPPEEYDEAIGKSGSKWSLPQYQRTGPPDPERMKKMLALYPMRRLGKPEDLGNAAVFLASDVASFITGQAISVSGGYTMH